MMKLYHVDRDWNGLPEGTLFVTDTDRISASEKEIHAAGLRYNYISFITDDAKKIRSFNTDPVTAADRIYAEVDAREAADRRRADGLAI